MKSIYSWDYTPLVSSKILRPKTAFEGAMRESEKEKRKQVKKYKELTREELEKYNNPDSLSL